MLPLTLDISATSLGERPPKAASGESAWLGRCIGFDVYGPDGRVGTVTHVRFGAVGRPDAVVVRSGLFIRRYTVVRWDHVDHIEPSQRRLTLTTLLADAPAGRSKPGGQPSRTKHEPRRHPIPNVGVEA